MLRLLADKMTNIGTEGVVTAEIGETIAIIARICKERLDATQNHNTTSRGEMEEIRDGVAAVTETIGVIEEISAKETETSTSSVVTEVAIAILDQPFRVKIRGATTIDNRSRSLPSLTPPRNFRRRF